MIPQPGKQIITKYIFSNISRNKDNQTMEFGQLIEYNMRNICLEKLFTKYYENVIPRPFSKVLWSLIFSYVKLRTFEIY